MCDFCEGDRLPYTHRYGAIWLDNDFNKPVLKTSCNKCPPFAECSAKDMTVNIVIDINYCPICGRELSKEAKENG